MSGFRFNEWGWSAQTMDGVTATLTIPAPGVYTIQLWAREDGLRVDRLLLTLDAGFVPAGGGPAESPRAGDVQASLLPQPRSTTAAELVVNPDYLRAVARQKQLAQLWANILANPGSLALSPLAVLAPLAYNRRRRRQVRGVTAVFLALVMLLLLVALASGGGLGLVGPSTAVIGPSNQWAVLYLPSSTTTIDYDYDPQDRLTAAGYDSGAAFAYSYDAAGNTTSMARRS